MKTMSSLYLSTWAPTMTMSVEILFKFKNKQNMNNKQAKRKTLRSSIPMNRKMWQILVRSGSK